MSNESEGRKGAVDFRERHGLGLGPIEDVFSLPELVRVDVVCIDAGDEEHGLTARDEVTGATVIVVNSALPSVRFRSTLAHEVGHLVFGEDLTRVATHAFTSDSETRAHAFARHLLLPLGAVRKAHEDFSDLNDERLLDWCVRRYGVSPRIGAYQLNNAGIIDDATCDRFTRLSAGQLAWTNGWSSVFRERENEVRLDRQPLLLQGLATRAYREGRLPAGDLAALTGVSVREIEEKIGFVSDRPQTDLEPEDFGDDDLPDAL